MFFAFRIIVLVAAVVVLAIPPAWAGVLPQPLLQWAFDEADSGAGNALDNGVNPPANDGLFMGGATRTSDTPGGASTGAANLLNDADGYIQASTTDSLEGLAEITITAWVNVQGDPAFESDNNRLAALQADADSDFAGFSFNLVSPSEGEYTADNWQLGMFIGGVNEFDFLRSTADVTGRGGEWVFVSTTYDMEIADHTLSFYIGGDDVADAVVQLGDPKPFMLSGDIANTGVNFYVGKTDAAPAANTSLEGFMDDVRIYGSALTLDQLEVIRVEGITSSDPFEADFDEDGDVDGNDFLLWQVGFGANITSGATKMDGDYDNDGDVDGNDFLGWQVEFPSPGEGSGSAAVPEPGSGLLALALCWLALFSPALRR